MPSLESLRRLSTSYDVVMVAQPLTFLAWLSDTFDDATMVV
jgi:hypothetical protein